MKIFCANTGRCGSEYLSHVFRRFTDIPSFHEPFPRGIGDVLREVNEDEVSEVTRIILNRKLAKIAARSNNDGDYFESSQMFAKTFLWEVLDMFSDVVCIYLERPKVDVLRSYATLHGNYRPSEWLLLPQWKRNILRCEKNMTWLELQAFNWDEVKARFEKYQGRFSKSYSLRFEDLNNPVELTEMLEILGIRHRKIENLAGLARNGAGKPLVALEEAMAMDGVPKLGGFTTDYQDGISDDHWG
jgi:hypothetical protein